MPASFLLPPPLFSQIKGQAEAEYPDECCGFILKQGSEWSRVVPFRNTLKENHAQNPQQFSRSSKTAFWIDPMELLRFQKAIRESGETIDVLYHSHTDRPADPSSVDLEFMQNYSARVKYLIVAVFQGKVTDIRFHTAETHKGFS